jgi:hypothetical protein
MTKAIKVRINIQKGFALLDMRNTFHTPQRLLLLGIKLKWRENEVILFSLPSTS